MKKIIFACTVFLLVAVSVGGQQTSPTDTGKMEAVPPQGVTMDTGAAPLQRGDTGSVARPPESILADTAAVNPPQESIPADTGDVAAPADTATVPQPADTGATPVWEPAPADTVAVPSPGPESSPADSSVVAPEVEGGIPPEVKQPLRFAVGLVFNDEAPLSIRNWFNPKVGLDFGVGLAVRTVEDQRAVVPSPESTTTFFDLSFDLGLPLRAFRHNKVDFILRPGFGFRTRPAFDTTAGVISVATGLELELNGSAGLEYYPIENASFGLFAGFALIADRPGASGNTILRLESRPSKKGVNFAFRYYLF